MTPVKAIRAKCIECNCGNLAEVKRCIMPDCPLYPYRMGHNPARKGKGGNISAIQNAQETLHEVEE